MTYKQDNILIVKYLSHQCSKKDGTERYEAKRIRQLRLVLADFITLICVGEKSILAFKTVTEGLLPDVEVNIDQYLPSSNKSKVIAEIKTR